MRKITLILLVFLCGVSGVRASDLTSLENLVEQWVGLRSEIAAEKRAWMRQELQWDREIALLEEESCRLDDMIWREKKLSSDKEGVTADQLERRDELKTVVADVGLVADQYAVVVSAVKQWIPVPLQSENLLRVCDTTSNAGLASTRRMQNLLSSLSEIENIKHNSHIVRELITIEGGVRREMDVIYLGLAAVYAVSPDNSVAAIGSLAPTGWRWLEEAGISAEVRKMISIKQQKLPPEIVNLTINGATGEWPENFMILPIDKDAREVPQ